MIDVNPIGTDRREERRLARLGCANPICILCAYVDPVALLAVEVGWLDAHGVPRTLFEGHHGVGENLDPHFIVLICRNCHAKAGEGLLRAGIPMSPEPDELMRVCLMLDGLAVHQEMIAEALRRWAVLLRSIAERDDPQ